MTGIANIALLSEETGRIFGLDAQLLFDILIQGLAVFLLFIFLTYVLINPVRKVLEDRQNKIKDDLSHAATDRAEAEKLRAEYDEKSSSATPRWTRSPRRRKRQDALSTEQTAKPSLKKNV